MIRARSPRLPGRVAWPRAGLACPHHEAAAEEDAAKPASRYPAERAAGPGSGYLASAGGGCGPGV